MGNNNVLDQQNRMGYESDITKTFLTSTIMSNSTPLTTSLSTGSVGKKNKSTLELPIFVYAIIGIVAVIVILSSICTCFIGCQMYKRGTFRPQTSIDGGAVGTVALSEFTSNGWASFGSGKVLCMLFYQYHRESWPDKGIILWSAIRH